MRTKAEALAIDELLIARILVNTIPEPNSGCWLWVGSINDKGYGSITVNGKQGHKVHRIMLEHFLKQPLGERFACHTCDNKICVNPQHLYAGTRQDNSNDAVSRGRLHSRMILVNGDIVSLSVYSRQHGMNPRKVWRRIKDSGLSPEQAVCSGTLSKKNRTTGLIPRSAKLTPSDVIKMRSLAAKGCENGELAAIFGVKKNTACMIVRGHKWKSLLPSNAEYLGATND